MDRKVLGVALHLAVAARHAECCRVLLFSGADVDEKNSHGSTSMHVAAEAGAREVMQVLLEFQASLNIRNADGKCAIAVSNNSATRQLIAAEVQRHDATSLTCEKCLIRRAGQAEVSRLSFPA